MLPRTFWDAILVPRGLEIHYGLIAFALFKKFKPTGSNNRGLLGYPSQLNKPPNILLTLANCPSFVTSSKPLQMINPSDSDLIAGEGSAADFWYKTP